MMLFLLKGFGNSSALAEKIKNPVLTGFGKDDGDGSQFKALPITVDDVQRQYGALKEKFFGKKRPNHQSDVFSVVRLQNSIFHCFTPH